MSIIPLRLVWGVGVLLGRPVGAVVFLRRHARLSVEHLIPGAPVLAGTHALLEVGDMPLTLLIGALGLNHEVYSDLLNYRILGG